MGERIQEGEDGVGTAIREYLWRAARRPDNWTDGHACAALDRPADTPVMEIEWKLSIKSRGDLKTNIYFNVP